MGIIRELPPGLVNQIAAGEVVERPASVLKELVENSIDAGARRINVVIDGAGSTLIRVQDDGIGLFREDLPRAFLRHATSKIGSFDDLVSAKTLGFRGEALASIASVSRVTVETRHAEEVLGSRLVLDPDGSPEIRDWGGPVGTTIAIRDLFFNVPVRRKYLKSPQTEQGHLVDTLSRLAMGFPEIQFDLSTVSRKLLSLPSRPSPLLRLLDLYPQFSEEDLVSNVRSSPEQTVTVFLLRPDRVRRDRQYQHLFINRRWVRHPGLLEAMTQGAAGRLSRDVHVGAWVYLDLPPEKLDVNVHPTKREVRFLEGDRLFSLLRRVVEESFPMFDMRGSGGTAERVAEGTREGTGPSGLFRPEGTMPFEGASARPGVEERGMERPEAPAAMEGGPSPPFRLAERKGPGGWGGRRGVGPETGAPPSFTRLPDLLKGLPSSFSGDRTSGLPLGVLGQIGGTFLVLSFGDGLAIVDWHTAHERVRYEKYRKELERGTVSKSPLILPVLHKVPLSVADSLDSRLEELSHLGFDMDRSGPDVFRIRTVPLLLKDEDPVGMINDLAATSENFSHPVLRSDRIDHALMTISCHESVRKNDAIDPRDGERLVRQLLETEHPYTCPHGRPTMLRIGRGDLDQWFGR